MFMHIVVCTYKLAHLSACMGVRLHSCVCMHVVSYLTPDVLTQHFQVMFTFCTVGFVYETSFSLKSMTVFPHLLIIIFCRVLFYM